MTEASEGELRQARHHVEAAIENLRLARHYAGQSMEYTLEVRWFGGHENDWHDVVIGELNPPVKYVSFPPDEGGFLASPGNPEGPQG